MEYESLELQSQRKEYSIEQELQSQRKEYSIEQELPLDDEHTSLLNEFTKLTNELIFEGQVTKSKQRTIETNIQRISEKILVSRQRLREVALQMTSHLEMLSKEEGKGKELRDTFLQIHSQILDMSSSHMRILDMHHSTGLLPHKTNEFMTSFSKLRYIELSVEHQAWHSSCMRLLTMLRGTAAVVDFYADAHYRVNTTHQLLTGKYYPELPGLYMKTKSIYRQNFANFQNTLFEVYTTGKGDLDSALKNIAQLHLYHTVETVNAHTKMLRGEMLRGEMMHIKPDTHSDNLNLLLEEVDRQVQTVTNAIANLIKNLEQRIPDLSMRSSELLSATGGLYMTSLRFYTFPIAIYED
eukprot:7271912-Prymnesium_polylepis.1